MARFTIPYGIVDNTTIVATDNLIVTINKKDIADIERQLTENNFSPYLADLPASVYEKICSRGMAAGPALCTKAGITFSANLAIGFSEILPVDILPLLNDEIARPLKANMQAQLPELFS